MVGRAGGLQLLVALLGGEPLLMLLRLSYLAACAWPADPSAFRMQWMIPSRRRPGAAFPRVGRLPRASRPSSRDRTDLPAYPCGRRRIDSPPGAAPSPRP